MNVQCVPSILLRYPEMSVVGIEPRDGKTEAPTEGHGVGRMAEALI